MGFLLSSDKGDNMPIKIIQVDDEGNEQQLESLPDEIIKASDTYKQVLTESIERRKEIKELKAKLQTPVEEKPTEEIKQPNVDVAEIEKRVTESVAEKVVNSVLSALQERETKTKTLEQSVNNLLSEYDLPSDFRDTLTLIYEVSPEKAKQQAQVLAKTVKPFGQVATPKRTDEDLMKAVKKQLKLGD